ncbi:MAG: ORF6N domain-containing protein [Bacteroides sp.]|nr:ORF6N domain-containing protein [Bacteroides sp.]MCM1085289.1 ORF6N domain-containing protein [Bacteroides sp.]
MKKNNNTHPVFNIQDKLIPLRGQYVLLDVDVAAIYGVETKHVNQAVRNNPEKFPEGHIIDFDRQSFANLKSKFLTSSLPENQHGGNRKLPHAFTEKGLYMLATILKSPTATTRWNNFYFYENKHFN